MSCYNPIIAYQHKKGQKLIFLQRDMFDNNLQFINTYINRKYLQRKINLYENTGIIHLDNFIKIPCNKCIGCRLTKSREWAIRCVLEAEEYKENYFITLTYANEHLKSFSLDATDLQKFIKKMRRYYDYHYKHKGIRFLACGEYGEERKRPHFHIIAFNLPIQDLELLQTTPNNDRLYISKTLTDTWGKGRVIIGEVNWHTSAYVARYITKKLKNNNEIYKDKKPEFIRMSNRPGIARNHYEKHKHDIYKNDEIIYTNKKGLAVTTIPPKYFDKLHKENYEEAIERLKLRRRKNAENKEIIELEKTDLTLDEYLEIKKRTKEKSIKCLTREKICDEYE